MKRKKDHVGFIPALIFLFLLLLFQSSTNAKNSVKKCTDEDLKKVQGPNTPKGFILCQKNKEAYIVKKYITYPFEVQLRCKVHKFDSKEKAKLELCPNSSSDASQQVNASDPTVAKPCKTKSDNCKKGKCRTIREYTKKNKVKDLDPAIKLIIGIPPTASVERLVKDKTKYCFCEPGYNSSVCSQKCPDGFYGAFCIHNCSRHCLKQPCDPKTGKCKPCQPGYAGVKCLDRMTTHDCKEKTSNCVHGKCIKSEDPKLGQAPIFAPCVCNTGWAGRFCNTECSNNTYGKYTYSNPLNEYKCEEDCGACEIFPCDPKSGNCPGGRCSSPIYKPKKCRETVQGKNGRKIVGDMNMYLPQPRFRRSPADVTVVGSRERRKFSGEVKNFVSDSLVQSSSKSGLPGSAEDYEVVILDIQDVGTSRKRKSIPRRELRQAEAPSGLDIDFSVALPPSTDSTTNLQEAVTSALKENSGNFKSDVIPDIQINPDSISVRVAAAAAGGSDETSTFPAIPVMAVLGALVLVMIVVVVIVSRGKKKAEGKAKAYADQGMHPRSRSVSSRKTSGRTSQHSAAQPSHRSVSKSRHSQNTKPSTTSTTMANRAVSRV